MTLAGVPLVNVLLLLIVAFSAGLAVSAATAVIISVLGILPHISAVMGADRFFKAYPLALWLGISIGGAMHLLDLRLPPTLFSTLLFFAAELFWGLYTGAFLSALAEVLDVFPVINRALGIKRSAELIAVTLALSKAFGTLLYYLTPYFRFS